MSDWVWQEKEPQLRAEHKRWAPEALGSMEETGRPSVSSGTFPRCFLISLGREGSRTGLHLLPVTR